MEVTWVPGNLPFNPLSSVAAFPEESVVSCLDSDPYMTPTRRISIFSRTLELKAPLFPGVPHSHPVSSLQRDT